MRRLDRLDPQGSIEWRQAEARRHHPRWRRELARAALVCGATSYLRHVRSGRTKPSPWLAGLLKRKPPKLVAVALANKTARIIWKLMTSGDRYDPARAWAPSDSAADAIGIAA